MIKGPISSRLHFLETTYTFKHYLQLGEAALWLWRVNKLDEYRKGYDNQYSNYCSQTMITA